MDLQDKTVLVTGASSGIGKAIAIAFARKRANVLVHYGRNQKGAQDTLKEVEKYSGGRICQADLMEGEQISALFDDIRRTTPSIDVLVNNAGDARAGDIDDEASWDYEYRNILLSAVRVSHGFLAMPSSRLRKIINITSIYGNLRSGEPEYLQYSAFKAALANVTTTLNRATAPNVIVNAVAPGYTDTPAWAGVAREVRETYAGATLIGRFVMAEEIAHAAVFIAENDALVGQVLTVDGGTALKGMP